MLTQEYMKQNFIRLSPDVKLGKEVRIFSFVNAYGCEIGDFTKIGAFVEIQKGVKIGKNCKISSHTFICEGVIVEDEVFVGHNVTFVNDLYPKAVNEEGQLQTDSDWKVIPTIIQKGASIGSSVTILAGITVGQSAIIGAGSVVTKDIPPYSIAVGVPAKVKRIIESIQKKGACAPSRPAK